MKKKIVALVLVCVLVFGIAVGGTLAWLADKTESITNTFTVGDINITLAETTTTYKMVPGVEINKNPIVTVKADSEACWLFVKIEETAALDDYITYAVADGWTLLEEGVYYREVAATTADTPFHVLANDKVTVKNDVTKTMIEAVNSDSDLVELTFTAYAVQQNDAIADAAAAWNIAQDDANYN